jgi:phosphoglycerol transferase MdoB-like AlkP superfamily enzyme
MESQTNSVEALFEKTGDYLETRMELLKLQTVNSASDLTSSVVSKLILVLIISLIMLLINTGLAIWIGDELGKMYYGFFIVGGFYIIVAIFLYAFRSKWIKRPVNDMLIKKMLN